MQGYHLCSVPVPKSSSGLSSDALISRAASTLSDLKASVPGLIDQTEQVVFVVVDMIISESLVI